MSAEEAGGDENAKVSGRDPTDHRRRETLRAAKGIALGLVVGSIVVLLARDRRRSSAESA